MFVNSCSPLFLRGFLFYLRFIFERNVRPVTPTTSKTSRSRCSTKFICSPREKCHNGVIGALSLAQVPRSGKQAARAISASDARAVLTRPVALVAFQILRGILKPAPAAHGLFCKTSYSQNIRHSAIGPVRSPSSLGYGLLGVLCGRPALGCSSAKPRRNYSRARTPFFGAAPYP